MNSQTITLQERVLAAPKPGNRQLNKLQEVVE